MSNDPVQANTAKQVNKRIRAKTNQRVTQAARASRAELTSRIAKLDEEWDMERWLETNASTIALVGTVLGLTVNRRFLAIPCVVLSFLLLHALQGWCPPVPIMRRFGVRTRKEIDEEKYALKALRGDFERVAANGTAKPKPENALHAVRV
jgi:hypothetical protein